MRRTCQPVGLAHAEADGEQRERVDHVHAEVEDTLEHHHNQPQLHNTRGDRRLEAARLDGLACIAKLQRASLVVGRRRSQEAQG